MSMSDPIADFLTRIRNAQMAQMPEVSCPSSKIKVAISEVLESEGYINGFAVQEVAGKQVLNVVLKYFRSKPVIEEINRMSRPGLRQYKSKDDIPQVKGGLGVVILSTNKGGMTDRAAKAAGVGGELICSVF